jgi:hypothetical protein
MSNLSCIGFDAPSSESFHSLLERAFEQATPPAGLEGWKRHARFLDPSGAMLAVHADDGAIHCLTPFFVPADGGTRWHVRSSAPHRDHDCADCSGTDCDVLDDAAQLVTRSAVQLLYFDAYGEWLREPRNYELQVVAFASRLSLCASDAEWEAAQAAQFGEAAPDEPCEPGKPMRLAEQAFMPYGMFGNEGHLGARARAWVTGDVISLSHPTNELTGQRFTWARVASLMGELDIVAPFEHDIARTNRMRALADAWLVGSPTQVPPPPARRGFWRKLSGRP